jgi:hypothetical protein
MGGRGGHRAGLIACGCPHHPRQQLRDASAVLLDGREFRGLGCVPVHSETHRNHRRQAAGSVRVRAAHALRAAQANSVYWGKTDGARFQVRRVPPRPRGKGPKGHAAGAKTPVPRLHSRVCPRRGAASPTTVSNHPARIWRLRQGQKAVNAVRRIGVPHRRGCKFTWFRGCAARRLLC